MPTMEELLQAFAKLYDEGKIEQAMEIAGLIKQMQDMEDQQTEGQVAPDEIPTPMEEPVGPSVVRPELGPEEQLIGALETIASLGTGMTTGLFGTVGGTLQGLAQAILSGELGSPEAARLVEQYASRGAEAGTYAPRTEAGQRMTQAIAEPLSQLPPLLSPSGVGAPVSGAAVRQARLRAPSFDEQMARAAQMADEAASRGAGAIRGGVETFGQGVQTGAEAIAPAVRAMRPTVTGSPEDVAAARQAGIRVMTTDVVPPQTFITRGMQATGEKIPIVGTGGQRAAQQRERVAAVEKIVEEYKTPDEIVLIRDLADDFLETRGATVDKFYGQKMDVLRNVEGSGAVPVDKAIAVIDEKINELTPLGIESSLGPIVDKLKEYRQGLQNKTSLQIERLRKQLRQEFKDPKLAAAKSEGDKAMSAVYSALLKDMAEFIRQNSGDAAVNKWKVASRELAEMQFDLNKSALKNAFDQAKVTPEAAANLLFAGKASDNQALFDNLSAKGKRAARIAVINRAAQNAGGIDNISPDKFANQVKKYGNQVGIFFPEDERAIVNGLVKALELTKRGGQAAASPPTGIQAVPYMFVDVLSSTFGGPMGATVIGASLGGLARFYESRPVRGLLTALGKSKKGSEAERRIFAQLRTEAAKAAKKVIEQSAPDAQVARELAKRAVPATAPETARTQLRELEESDQ